MLYEEWKSRYKNLKNFNTVLQRCPRFWPLAPPRGMNPGVYSLGISEDPPRYLSSKFYASVRSDCWDISIWKTLTQCDGNGNWNANANVDDQGDYNSSPCTSYRRAKNARVVFLVHDTSSQCDAGTGKVSWIYFIRFRSYGPDTVNYMELSQEEIIQKPKMQELSSLFMTHRLSVMQALVKFHEYISYGLGVMARTQLTIWN